MVARRSRNDRSTRRLFRVQTYPQTTAGQEIASLVADEVLQSILSFSDVSCRFDFLIVDDVFGRSRGSLTAGGFDEADTAHELQAVFVEEFFSLAVEATLNAGYTVLLKTIVDALGIDEHQRNCQKHDR